MVRNLGLVLICALLSACATTSPTKYYSIEQYARCKELKYRMLSLPATNNSIEAAQRNAEWDNFNRTFRENGC